MAAERASSKAAAEEKKRLIRNAMRLVALAYAVMISLTLLVHYDYISVHPKSMKAETLKGFAARVEYALRYQSLLVLWLVINIFVVIHGRFVNWAINPLDDKTESRVQLRKNVLTNSFETVVVSALSQLIFVSFAQAATILKFIPLINFLQFIGRVTFLIGYPMNRAFGFQMSIFPNLVLVGYNTFRLGSFVGLY